MRRSRRCTKGGSRGTEARGLVGGPSKETRVTGRSRGPGRRLPHPANRRVNGRRSNSVARAVARGRIGRSCEKAGATSRSIKRAASRGLNAGPTAVRYVSRARQFPGHLSHTRGRAEAPGRASRAARKRAGRDRSRPARCAHSLPRPGGFERGAACVRRGRCPGTSRRRPVVSGPQPPRTSPVTPAGFRSWIDRPRQRG
jgi:hypothetical protein